ncbi:hypothetical protein GGE12_000034 [Rhizobium mongolense]|uniref:Guanylate cyclase domain-containing protein n=1 Tax=Rhizobium mongolense TaxID=57676 RepID=A0A7W6RGY6_9HYPH|nr:hypothetical protein [Rhizobium mongolense]
MDRKLSAILAADVVGYSALMERDEAGTFERLRAGRKELFEPEIARHHGQIFKLMGDGMLAEFGSVVDAVECAVSLQRGLAERNAAVPEDQRIRVRIGINLGDVIVEGEDRYGEGVNVAARLQQLADAGGICVSAKVAREVEKKLALGFESMGAEGEEYRRTGAGLPRHPCGTSPTPTSAVIASALGLGSSNRASPYSGFGRDGLAILADCDSKRQTVGSGAAVRQLWRRRGDRTPRRWPY